MVCWPFLWLKWTNIWILWRRVRKIYRLYNKCEKKLLTYKCKAQRGQWMSRVEMLTIFDTCYQRRFSYNYENWENCQNVIRIYKALLLSHLLSFTICYRLRYFKSKYIFPTNWICNFLELRVTGFCTATRMLRMKK